MRWGKNWRLYLTPGDGLLISLLEEFLSKSVSFINDISLCSARHLLSSQKGNYLFRPGNNISYCLSSRARREAKSRRRKKQSRGLLFPDWRMPGSLTPLSRFLVLRQNGLCMWVCAFKGMYECVCVCETGVKGPGEIFSLPCLKYPTLTHSFYEHLSTCYVQGLSPGTEGPLEWRRTPSPLGLHPGVHSALKLCFHLMLLRLQYGRTGLASKP